MTTVIMENDYGHLHIPGWKINLSKQQIIFKCIDKNLPTPFIGIWERINIGAFMLWIIVLSVLLLRREKMGRLEFISAGR